MARQTEERDVYRIPENFVDTGTVMGGMFKLRNVIEAGAIAAVFILPLFKINISLTAKIIIACLTALPLGLLALTGVNGESLTSFILGFFKFLQNKRVIGKGGTVKPKPEPKQAKPKKSKVHREELVDRYDDFDDEFHDDFSRPAKEHHPRRSFDSEPKEKKKPIESPKPNNPVAQYLPIEDISNGIIYTRDHRYVKIIEVSPINFLLRSAREQRNIIYSITVTADSEKELEWRIDELKKLLISQDIEVSHCHFREEQAFLSALPLVSLDKHLFFARSKRNILTTGVASCYPFTSFEMCDDNGILLGVNKHNNSLIIVDIFNSRIYKNANMAILGTSGSGKTFTMQLMALRMRRKNIQTFIIAPLKGNEFYRACNNIGGEFIQISPASPNCINIMEIRKTDTTVADLLDAPNIDKSMLAGKIQKLHIFFSLLIPDMTYEEKQLLDDALIKTYALKGITHNNDTLVDSEHPEQYKEMPILGDLHEVLKQSPETKRLANIINRFVGGSARSFNQQTNVRLDNKYIVLDISELTGDLLTVGMFVALDYVWDKAKVDRTAEKAIFIDETWQLIGAASNRLAAEFVLEIFKIIRGYGGSAICATQDLNDFFSLEDGKYGKGIINNAKTKIVLNLEDEEAQRVQDILHLSETETMAITHFERGNGLISTNNNNITVEFKVSELEKELITTDRRELKEIVDRVRKQVDHNTLITDL